MRPARILSVFGLWVAGSQAAPHNRALPEGDIKDLLEATVGSRVHLDGGHALKEHMRNSTRNAAVSATDKESHTARFISSQFGPRLDDPHIGDIQITLINATPYKWTRVYKHSYQIYNWNSWPETVEPGESWAYCVRNSQIGLNSDDAGEVVYILEGTETPMSFEIQYEMTSLSKYQVHVQFHEELQTKTTAKNGRILIGDNASAGLSGAVSADRGGCSFHIAGQEGDFTSTTDWHKPTQGGWMQDLLPAIGDYPLKEIVMLRSHHAALDTTEGGYELTGAAGFKGGQAVTQSKPVAAQLSEEGVRILDERVYYSHEKEFVHAHVSKAGKSGAIGRRLIDVVDAINSFNDAHPGELIIWDFHARTIILDEDYAPFGEKLREQFYQFLKDNLKHRASLPKLLDYTELTLNELVGNGTSAVVLRFDNWANVPGPEEGFVTTDNFPVDCHWSAMYDPQDVLNDQIKHLGKKEPRGGKAHSNQFLRSISGVNLLMLEDMTLNLMARELMTYFRHQFWKVFTDQRYPNWLSMDNFEGGEMKGFVIAMNKCFVAGNCGDWVKG